MLTPGARRASIRPRRDHGVRGGRPDDSGATDRLRSYADDARWAATEQELHTLLVALASRADLPDDRRSRYQHAATEQEIRHGALHEDVIADARDHVHIFIRQIAGLPDRAAVG